MVVFKGKAMKKKIFCDMVGCKKKSMHVNSARYRRRLTVKSKTKGLEYTAFAPRHETRMDTDVLRAAIRVGLGYCSSVVVLSNSTSDTGSYT